MLQRHDHWQFHRRREPAGEDRTGAVGQLDGAVHERVPGAPDPARGRPQPVPLAVGRRQVPRVGGQQERSEARAAVRHKPIHANDSILDPHPGGAGAA